MSTESQGRITRHVHEVPHAKAPLGIEVDRAPSPRYLSVRHPEEPTSRT